MNTDMAPVLEGLAKVSQRLRELSKEVAAVEDRLTERLESLWGYAAEHFHVERGRRNCPVCREHDKKCPKCHE